MRRWLALAAVLASVVCQTSVALADGREDPVDGTADTVEEAVRVTLLKSGDDYTVRGVAGGSTGQHQGCVWSVVFAPELEDVPYGTDPGPRPSPEARFALLLCDGQIVQPIWVEPNDIVDLDAAAREAAQRYVEDVLVPAVHIGVNPSAKGLVGLESWYWITGFDGTVTAPPITAFGLTIDVRMGSGTVRWDFGDRTAIDGDLGKAYPAESTVRHAHQRDGRFSVTADIALLPEYRVDGGAWIPLPPLTASATTTQQVEERQAVITGA